MTKKRILFIIWSFSYGGGAERILANVVNNLDYNKYDVEILEYLHSDIGEEQVDERAKILKPVLDITNRNIFNRIKNRLMDRFFIRYCPELVRKYYLNKTYDVEISFNYLIPSFLLSKKSGKRIAWVHGTIDDLEDKAVFRRLQGKHFKKVDHIVAISEQTERSVLKLYPECAEKVQRIYNGYDFDKMVPGEGPLETFDLLYCNRFDACKDPMFLLEVVRKLKEENIFFKLKMLGTGPLLDKAKRYVLQNGLEAQVELTGYVNKPYRYFERCRVFCLSSRAEGFPTTVVEAMYFGKPFVTTPVAGIRELSAGESCGLVADNVSEYVRKVKMLLQDDILYSRMSRDCRNEVQNYSIQKQIEEIEQLIDG